MILKVKEGVLMSSIIYKTCIEGRTKIINRTAGIIDQIVSIKVPSEKNL